MREVFEKIYQGLDVAYGQHQSEGKRADGKQEGKSYIVRELVTEELWDNHLNGVGPSLGIIPIMADNKAKWGCIDIDQYPIDYKKIIHKVRELSLPLIPCRSKSGGLHIFLFFSKPVPAKDIRYKLREVASCLGYSSAEIFPKQSSILIEKGDLGNFLNLPYYNHKETTRYAYKDDGTAASLVEFVNMYNLYVKETIDDIAIQIPGEVIKDGPPCLQQLCTQGFPEGTRNNGLFNIGVYLRKFDPDNWQSLLEDHNRNFMSPPLAANEVITVIKQLDKKDYNFRCKDAPINSFCNSKVCRTRKFGIGSSENTPEFGAMTVQLSDPVVWFLDVNDNRLEFSTEELQIQTKFQRKCMEYLRKMPPKMKESQWQETLQILMDNATVIKVSRDGSVSGQFETYLQEFCTDRAQALNKEELLLRKPWTEDGKTYFRLKDLMDYLSRNKFTHLNTGQIIARIREIGGHSEFFKIKGRGVNVWVIPAYQQQDSEFDIKELDETPF